MRIRKTLASLHGQLALAFLALSVVSIGVAAALAGLGLHRAVDDYLARRSSQTSSAAAAVAVAAYESAGGWTPQALARVRTRLAVSEQEYRLRSDGRTLLNTGGGVRGVAPLASEPIVAGGREVGRLEILEPTGGALSHSNDSLIRTVDRTYLFASAIAGALAIAAGLVVAHRLSRPLARLAVTADGIAEGAREVDTVGGPVEVQRVASALSSLARDLERQTVARRQLAEDLSHELRTPLTLIQGRIEALQDGFATIDADALEDIRQEVVRMGRLVAQIEHLASEAAERPALLLSPTRLDLLVADVERTFRPSLEKRGVRTELVATEVTAEIDQDATVQILTNLLVNAQIHGPGGTVRVVVGPSGPEAVVQVCDSGRIASTEAARIFRRFHRGPAVSPTPGLGVGLTIARQLAERQGGRLDLVAEAQTTTFEFAVPRSSDTNARRA